MPSGPARRMTGAVHDDVGAPAADDVAHRLDPRLRCRMPLDIDGRLGAELPRQRQSRAFGRADGDDAAGPHLLRRGDGEDADRPGALDDDRIAPGETAGLDRAVEAADAGGQRFGQRAEQQAHIVGQLVDLGAGQFTEIDVDVLRPAAPQVRRPVETEIAAVVDRLRALVGLLGIALAPVAEAAGHQRREHQLGADADGLAHVIGLQFRPDLDDHTRQFVAQRERPRQRLWPMTL